MKICKRPLHTVAFLCAVSLFSLGAQNGLAGTTTYTIQTGNFSATQNVPTGGGSAGEFNNSSTEVGFFAHNGGQDDASAFQTLTTNGVGNGTARTLQVGDSFSVTMFSALNPFGFEGVYFDDNTTYNSFSNYNTNERTAVVLGSSGNWIIENNGTSVDTGIAANNSITANLTITSSNTFNMAITNNSNSTTTTYYDLVMKNAPGTTARIQSFSLIDQNDNNTVSGKDSNFYVKNGSLTNTGSVTIGGSNSTFTLSGVIADGLLNSSTTTGSFNSLTKIGTGNITLSGANTYTGATTINAGTLSISSDGNLGIAPGSATASSLNFNPATNGSAALVTTADVTLNSNRGITLNSAAGATNFFGIGSGTTLSYGGIIAGSGSFVKNQPGTLLLTGNNTFGGTNNVFIDEGTVSVGTGGTLGATNGTTGLVNLGSSAFGGLNSILNVANSGVTLANPVLIRYLQTGGKTLSGTFTSGSSTYSGAISLADHLTITAANGGTLLFTGVISQAAGTGSSTPGSGLVNNTSPSGGFSTNGPGVIINSGASSTGIVEYDNAMTYAGDTVVNSGTLQFNGSGSLANSTIRLGNSGAATLNMSAPGGTSLPVTINVRPSTGTKTISAANTSGTATLGGHFALDDDVTVTETSSTGAMAITQGRSSATDTLTGTDIKSHTLTFSGAGNFNVGATSPTGFGTIYSSAGSGNVVMSGAGTLTFSDKNTFTGTTTINSGTLSASAAGALGNTSGITVNSGGTLLLSGSSSVTDRINNTATVTLNGGTFNTGGLSEHGSVGIGALTLQNSSTIDFFNNGATSSVINFANSSAATWASGKILTIADWTGSQAGGGADQLIFGSDSTGLNASQIAEIQFVNPGDLGPGTYGAMILGTGEIVPVPEPGTWAAAALALAVLGYQFPIIRRRKLSRA